jgi:cobalt-zinc-cadmium efflux system outer membrane protein
MITKSQVVALCLLPLLAVGCKNNPTAGLSDVQKIINSRTGQNIQWPQSTAERDQADAAVSQLLQTNLSVEAAVQVALLNNRTLRATLEEIGISRAEVLQAGLLRNPEFAASLRFPDRAPFGTDSEFSLASDFLDLLLLPLKKKVAALQFEQTKLRVSHEILQLAAEVKIGFYTVQARQQFLQRLQAIADLKDAGVDLSTRQHTAGNINDLELANQQAAWQQAKLELGKTQAQLRVDREQLNRLLGWDGANTVWKISDELPALPEKETAADDLESLAVKQRMDLRIAEQQVALASRALKLRRNTRYLPAAVKLGVDTERGSDRQRVTGPTLNLELPIFDHGQGAIVRLRAQQRQAQFQLEALVTNIRSEVRQAHGTLMATRELTDFYAHVYLPQRLRIVNETLLQYNAMQEGTFQLIAAKERELIAEREYTEAWRDYWIARAELEKAVGGKLPEGTMSVSSPPVPIPPEKVPAAEPQPAHQHNH